MYVKINNGQVEKFPYSIGLLRKDHPNTSFPKTLTEQTLASFGVYPVKETNPTVGEGQKLQKTWTPQYIDGEWLLNHQAVNMTDDEIAELDAVVANGVREKRGKMISDTDWMALSDNTLTAEWIAYRQALRDITNHVNFPYLADEDWPTKPV